MGRNRLIELLRHVAGYCYKLDSDWKGVLVGALVVVLVGIFGVDIPW